MRKMSFTRMLLLLFVMLAFTGVTQAQVSLTATGGTTSATYTTLNAAFAAIDSGTHTGTISISITANTTEPANTGAASATLNASGIGNASYTAISIAPSGGSWTVSGAATAGFPLIDLNGADNLTINGGGNLTITNTTASGTSATSTIRFTNDATSNTITNTTVLGGFTGSATTNGGTIYFATQNATSATGNDNNTISNCNLGPVNATTLPTKAIYSNGTTTTAAASNSGIVITGNNIYDYFGAAVTSAGIYLNSGTTDWTISNNKFYQTATRTQTSGGQHSAIWINNTSGNNFLVSGNTIGYASSSASGMYTFVGVSSSVFIPVYLNVGSATATSVQGNTVTALAMSGSMSGTSSSAAFRMIYVAEGLTTIGNVTGNIVGSQTATGAITYTSSSSSASDVIAIFNFGSYNWTVANNMIGGITAANSGTGAANIYGIRVNTGSTVTFTCQNNTVGGSVANSIQSTSTANGTVVAGIHNVNPIGTITGNTIRNLSTVSGTGTGTTAAVNGIMCNAGVAQAISGNLINNLTSTGASANINGIMMGSSSTAANINGNTINTLSGSGATSPVMSGISVLGGTTINIYRNKIYDLSESGAISTTAGAVNGLVLAGGTPVAAYNNLIGDLRAPAANLTDAIRGIAVTSTSTANYNVYYNTIYLNSSSTGTNFGTSGIFHAASSTASTAPLDLRNNIIVNLSAPSGTGVTAAYRRSSTALANYAATSNRNLFYAGTPGTSRLIMYDGTNSYQTMATYQAAVTTRDAASFTGETGFTYSTPGSFFQSITGGAANFLQPVAGIMTQAESGGAAVAGITDDYNGVTRPASGTAPDLGGWEFAGVTPMPVITLNSVTPGAASLCTAAARVINVTVTPNSGTVTSVVLNYNNGAAGSTPMTLVSGTTYTGTIPVASPVDATVSWSVVAVNSAGFSATYNGTSYTDELITNATASATATATALCAGSPDTLKATLIKNGNVTIGSGSASIPNNTAVGAFYGTWFGNGHAQILFTAAELTAQGLTAGNITALSLPVSALGSPATLNNFAIKMANVSATAITTFQSPAFTAVWGPANYTPVLGTNTHTFTTSFVWDGTSAILVDYCFSNSVTGSTSAINTYTTTSFGSFVNYNVDGATGAAACNTTTVTNTSSNRPILTFTGNTAPVPTAYSWSNGATVVGTTNPLIITPVASGSYTATITAGGCSKTTNTIAVTVSPLPAAPTATNSNQCGTQVPTASVADPNGYTTPTIKWYAALTGGTALQSSTSHTYTTAIAATTTFYVSVTNPATGCESSRTPITVTVSTPDAITAKANGTAGNTSSCFGSNISLTSVQTGTTNNYSYTWTASPAAGSGIATSVSGQSVTVTPTAAGIYTYTATAVDGSCATTSTVTDTVRNPFAAGTILATASPASTCAGGNDTLSAYYVRADTGTIGAQTTTEFGGGVYRYGYGTGDFRHQLLYTAAELNAAGFAAGNINALAFNVTSVGSGSANNYAIKMSNVTNTALTTTFVTPPSATSVYNAATYTAINGMNQHTFSTPFNWDGTSNVLVDICYTVTSTGSSSTLAATTPPAVSNVSLLGSTGACTATTGGTTYANRPLIWFNGNKKVLSSATTWSNGTTTVGTNNPQVVNPLTNTTYTATLTLNGCSAPSNPVTVTIAPLSAATATATSNTICAGQNDTLTATATGAGVPFTYSWSDGATVVGTTQTIVVSPASTKTYTVTITNACSQTAAAAKTITVNPIPAAAASSNTPVCSGNTLNLTGTTNIGTTFTWTGPNSFSSTSQNPSVTGVTTAAAGVYTFKATANGCTSPAAVTTVVVNPTPSAITVTPAAATICAGNVQSLVAAGGITADQTILSENFNAATNNWITANNSAGGTTPAGSAWTLKPYPYTYANIPATFASNDSTQFYITNSDTAGTGSVTNTTLQSPVFSTLAATSAYVDFYHNFRAWTNAANDSATVEVSSDGTNWAALRTFKGTSRGTSSGFVHDTVSLNAYVGLPTVYVRFHFTTTFGYYWAVDNVTVRGTLANAPVWSPVAGLYTDTLTTTAYTGTAAYKVFAKPTATATYTATYTSPAGCSASGAAVITVNPLPNATLTGAAALCVNAATTLTPATTGGTWTSSNTAIATVSSAGVVTGVAAGTDTIRYKVTNTNGCTDSSFKVVTINALPNAAITGTAAVCVNNTLTLTAGTSGGTWTSTNTALATVSNTGVVTGVAAGTDTIRYKVTNISGCTDSSFKVITINAMPSATLTGASALCVNATTTLTPVTTGGTWTSTNTAIATVSNTGVVTGIAAGTDTIRYKVTAAGGCTDSSFKVITINAMPSAAITGSAAVCVNNTLTLTAGTSGGTWTSTNTALATVSNTGVVTGVAAGTDTIRYKVTNISGCTDSSFKVITINAMPSATLTGASALCVNATTTLTPVTTGGTWTSTNTAIATVSNTGVVTGIAAGTDTIRYKVTAAGGCIDSSFKVITINPMPSAAITGSSVVCVNNTLTLTAGTPGGTWTSTNTALATVSNTGVVTGIAAGTDTIRYKVTNTSGCTDSSFKVITVNAVANAAISGLASLCVNDTTTLTGATAGGAWTSSNPAIATVNSTTGLVTGVSAGTDTITYSISAGCSATATKVITIKPLPTLTVTAGGPTTFCANDSVVLTAHAAGVTYQWYDAAGTIGNATDSVYTVHNTGVYTVAVTAINGCSNTTAPQSVTVNPLPVPVITANGVDMNTGTFTTYQWNLAGAPIGNATSSTYTATQNGDYTVTVTDGNGCSGTSAVYTMSKVGIEEHGGKGTIRIYPNPTKDIVYVDAAVPVNITVYSLDGRKIAYAAHAKSIDLGKFAAGAYTIVVSDENALFKVIQRIVKAE